HRHRRWLVRTQRAHRPQGRAGGGTGVGGPRGGQRTRRRRGGPHQPGAAVPPAGSQAGQLLRGVPMNGGRKFNLSVLGIVAVFVLAWFGKDSVAYGSIAVI